MVELRIQRDRNGKQEMRREKLLANAFLSPNNTRSSFNVRGAAKARRSANGSLHRSQNS